MSDDRFAADCAALVAARREARTWHAGFADRPPTNLEAAYRLQRAVAATLGDVVGWKIGAVTEAQREAMRVDRPVGAPLLAPWFYDVHADDIAELRVADFVAPRLECEIAYELALDLPARAAPYARDEVAAAVGRMRVGLEVVDSRLPVGATTLAQVADAFNNGAYVAGPATSDWREVDPSAIDIELAVVADDGATSTLATGSAKAIVDGDPFATVVMLANAQADLARGLRAGDLVTTGSCTGAPALPGPGLYRCDFGALGAFAVRFVP